MMTTPLHVPVLRQFALAPPHIFEQYSGAELKVFLPLVQFPWQSKAILEHDRPFPSYWGQEGPGWQAKSVCANAGV